MVFVAEWAVHEGSLEAHVLPHLPPEVRVAQTDGDRRVAGCQRRIVNVLAN
jgi:hypothetical protein